MRPLPSLTALAFSAICGTAALAAANDPASVSREIDSILKADWEKNKLQGNPAVDDHTFVRRIHLDIIGRIPTTREAEAFLTSKAPDKRAKLIDQLLASEGYVQHTFSYLADVLRAQSNGNQAGAITGAAYSTFLKESLRTNKPYDELVREMITAMGKSWDNGAIGYYMRDRGMPLDNMANTARVFLGTRVECAQCHNHPFDKWTQKQFYQMAAFTNPIATNDYSGMGVGGALDLLREEEQDLRATYKQANFPKGKKTTDAERKAYRQEGEALGKKAREAVDVLRKTKAPIREALNDVSQNLRYTNVSFNERRKLTLPHDYQYDDAKPRSEVTAATMFGHEATLKPGESQLQAYARWLTTENERFDKVIANRLWKRVFGLALIEPLDELMDISVPMNANLQARLEKLIVELNYDMKAYLRILYNTSAYQRQVTREEVAPGAIYHFTGPLLRRMTAEQMWDSFVTLINPSPDMPNQPLREQFTNRVLAAKKLSDSVDALSPEQILAGAEVAGKQYEKQSARVRELQKLLVEAREKEDKPTLNKVREELRDLQLQTRSSVNRHIIFPGMQKLASEMGVVPTVLNPKDKSGQTVASTGTDMMMASMTGNASAQDTVFLPGYDKPKLTREQQEAQKKAHEEVWAEEAQFFGIDSKNLRRYFNTRSDQSRNWVRAAELESPAPRGHYLREFGQSDRETIENANLDASVPQALAMMNGQLMPQILHRYSQLMLTVSKAPYPDEKVDAIYMTLLSRKPTENERQVWLKAQDQGLNTIEDLVYALLNTQQFIFIQ